MKKTMFSLEIIGFGARKRFFLEDFPTVYFTPSSEEHISFNYLSGGELGKRVFSGFPLLMGKNITPTIDAVISLLVEARNNSWFTDWRWKKSWVENYNHMKKFIIGMGLKTIIDLKTWFSFIAKNIMHTLIQVEPSTQNPSLKIKGYGMSFWR